eukprot:4523448-Amphidinium_carterae.1
MLCDCWGVSLPNVVAVVSRLPQVKVVQREAGELEEGGDGVAGAPLKPTCAVRSLCQMPLVNACDIMCQCVEQVLLTWGP